MKCFLHIGTEKTATTSIQSFLDLNRENLYQNGIIYTKSAGTRNNIKLAVAAYDQGRWDDMAISMGILKDGSNLEEFRHKTINDLKEEIAALCSDHPGFKIIFSSEHFQSRLTGITEIQRLKEILSGVGIDGIKVIVYLRDPVELANSLYSTAIKSGHTIRIPPPPENKYFNNICNHRKTLEKFGSVFGEQSLIPRLFIHSDLFNGSIIEDFLDVIGISLSSKHILPERKNEILSATGISILRKVNELIPRIVDDRINPQRADIVACFEKYFSGVRYLMPKELIDKYNEAFQESNEWVRSKYFPHKESLFPSEPFMEQSTPVIPEDEINHIASMIAELWINNQIRI